MTDYRQVDEDEDTPEATAFWEGQAHDPLGVTDSIPPPPSYPPADSSPEAVHQAAALLAAAFTEAIASQQPHQTHAPPPVVQALRGNWKWLRLGRNIPFAGLVLLIPLVGGQAPAFTVRDLIEVTGPLAPIGYLLPAGLIATAVWLGSKFKGPAGAVLGLFWSIASGIGKAAFWCASSRFGWVLVYPLAWSFGLGIVLAFGRSSASFLTGV
ncbi:hypothetical protein [Streptomyces sp. NPDC048272]|uniref:hypothetical protein n=1 Tax=Streptomyces sp. NPDC048272 TaxID=3154616 RepID=UPI0034135B80